MRSLNGVYAPSVNRTDRRVGHLFRGRFTGILVDQASALLEQARDVVRHPVRADRVRQPEEWPGSRDRSTAGLAEASPCLATDWLVRAFCDNRREALLGSRRLVADGVTVSRPWGAVNHPIDLGSEGFVERLPTRIDPDRPLRDGPPGHRRPVAKPLAD